MSTITPTDTALTREQVKAIRNADTVVLRWDHTDSERPDVLELVKETERTDGFGREDIRLPLPCPARVANYGQSTLGEEGERLRKAISGDWVILNVQHQDEYRTFASFIKPGDALEQSWVVDNRNSLLKEAGLTLHELKLRVLRGGDQVKVYTFMLDASVLNPHNTADRVRRER